MSFLDIIKTLFEMALVGFTLYAVLNEDKFIALERKIKASYRRRKIKAVRLAKANLLH